MRLFCYTAVKTEAYDNWSGELSSNLQQNPDLDDAGVELPDNPEDDLIQNEADAEVWYDLSQYSIDAESSSRTSIAQVLGQFSFLLFRYLYSPLPSSRYN